MKNCNSCGKCCIKYSNAQLSASADEIEHWENERPDIFSYVNDGQIWTEPTTGTQLTLCPWLRLEKGSTKYTCDIYDQRPDDCRVYPMTLDDMIMDDCEMLEPRDFANQKQARKDLEMLIQLAADY